MDHQTELKFQCLQLAIAMGAGPNAIDTAKEIEKYIRGPIDGGTVLRLASKAQKKSKTKAA